VPAAARSEDSVNVGSRLLNVLALPEELEGGVLKEVFGLMGWDSVTVSCETHKLVTLLGIEKDRLDDLSGGLGRFGRHED
jgi:hypothetical protein